MLSRDHQQANESPELCFEWIVRGFMVASVPAGEVS